MTEKTLIIFGLFIFIFPRLFNNKCYEVAKTIKCAVHCVGVGTAIVGILFWCGIIQKGNVLFIVIFSMLLLLDIILLLYKWKRDNGWISRIMCGISITLMFLAVMIENIDIMEIASAIIILLGSLIVLYVPYGKMQRTQKK